MQNSVIARTTAAVTTVLLVSKFTGFLRDVALAYAFGTSVESDAFVLAQSVLSIFSYLLFIALGIAFIPVFLKLKLSNDESELDAFVDSTYSVAGTIIFFACILGFLGADILIFLLAPGFSGEAHRLGVDLTRIIMPAVLFSFLSTIQGQQLRGNNIFMPSAFLAYPLNFSLILSFLFLAPVWGIRSAALAYVAGTVLQVFMLHPFVKKLGYRFHYRFDPRNSGLRKILVLTLPIMMGNTIQTIDVLVNRMLASGLEEGSIAALNYSNKLAIFVVGVVSLGAGTVCYTKMSELSASGEIDEFKEFLGSVVNLLNVIVVPAAVGMMALNVPITRFVFEYGAFDSRSSQMTSATLWFYSVGLVGFVLRDIITRAFYALNDAKTPMVNGGIAVVAGIVCNFIFIRFLGVGGLALATSVSGILGTLLLLLSLRKKLSGIGLAEIGKTFLKACVSALLMGVSVHTLYSALYGMTGNLPAALLGSVFCGILIYGMLIFLFNVKEVRSLAARLRHRSEK